METTIQTLEEQIIIIIRLCKHNSKVRLTRKKTNSNIVIIFSILLLLLLASVFLLPSSTFMYSTSYPYDHTALAFKPTPTNKNTNNNNTAPISKPPVVVNHPPVVKVGPNQTV